MRERELVNVVEGYVITGYVIIAVFSFFGTVISSFFTWAFLYQTDGGAPGDGFGFMITLAVIIPVWLILAIDSPFFARKHFTGNKASIKRLLYCALIPPLVSSVITGLLSLFFL